jgi:hypothetical protein
VSQFQQPGVGGDKFEAAAHNGHLMLFFPSQYDQNIPTVNGTADAVTTRIVDLDTGQVLDDAKVWGKAMVPQLKGAIPDGMVLGRLGQGQSKGGNNPPWILHPHTEQDVARAEQWLAANPRNQFGQPQQQAPAPAQNGWGQQAPSGPPAQQGWGQAPAPASPAPGTGGWGQAAAGQYNAAPQQSQFAGQWGNAVPAAQPAPAAAPVAPTATPSAPVPGYQAPTVDPGLVEALRKKGVQLPPGADMAQAEQIWAMVQGNPDVA